MSVGAIGSSGVDMVSRAAAAASSGGGAPAEMQVAVAKKAMQAQEQIASQLISTIPGVGQNLNRLA